VRLFEAQLPACDRTLDLFSPAWNLGDDRLSQAFTLREDIDLFTQSDLLDQLRQDDDALWIEPG